MIQGVPSKKQQQQIIIEERLNQGSVFYSLVKKPGNMLGSATSNNVLLIFIPKDDTLQYALENHKLPFGEFSNIKHKQNKDVVTVTTSSYTLPTGSNQMTINYTIKDEKGKDNKKTWTFQFFTKGVAQQWYQMLTKYKDQKLKKNTVQNQPSNYNNYNNSNNNNANNSSNINHTNNANKKPVPQQVKKQQQYASFILTDSKVLAAQEDPQNPKNPYASNLNKPVQKKGPSNSNLRVSGDAVEVAQESRIKLAYQALAPTLRDSRIKPQNQSAIPNNDWNFRFVKDPTRELVFQFEKAAYSAFNSNFQKYRDCKDTVYKFQDQFLFIQIADCNTPQSKKLKSQYRNYHYILQSCKLQIINVPLACLIEYLGCVCLVKAKLAKQGIRIKNKRELEQFLGALQQKTKISNSIIMNGKCALYDLTQTYGSIGEYQRIYVDDLDEYLPELNVKNKEKEQNTFFIRPSLMQYFEGRVMPGGNMQAQKNSKAQSQFSNALESQIRDIADCLSSEQIYIVNIFDLKQFLHYRGVNMKFLNRIYQQTKNKFVKRYLQTCLVAKLIKDEITYSMNYTIRQSKQERLEESVQSQIRYFIQGKTATSNEFWKKISLEYRRLYGTNINTNELIGGFLLSCLMTLIRGDYDLTKLDQSKSILKDQEIILKGFLRKLQPKVKSYFRFSQRIVETVEICKYSQQKQSIYNKLVEYMSLSSKQIPQSYNVNNSRQYILGYLSDFIEPQQYSPQSLPCSSQIYQLVNKEPPTAPSLKISLNYYTALNRYLKQNRDKINEGDYKKHYQNIQKSIDLINYWLQFQHPKVCEFFEKAAVFLEIFGNHQDSLQILQKSIEIANKSEHKNNKKIGLRHYMAGSQYLKAGKKKQAIQNLQKARECLQKQPGQQNQHAYTLSKLSSLQLNSGDTDSCIKYSRDALKSAKKGNMAQIHIIKIYQILCRAYQIKGQKDQLKKLSLVCARQFNKSQDRNVFSQMVKISLTGIVSRLSLDRSKSLLALSRVLKTDGLVKDQNGSIYDLMEKAKLNVIMEGFMQKADLCDKCLIQYNTKKQQLSLETKEFINILALIVGIVGIDFVEGLHDQKQFQ